MKEVEPIAWNRSLHMLLLSDDSLVPIVSWLDEDGEDCDPQEAVVFIAGKDGLGWFACVVEEFAKVSVN